MDQHELYDFLEKYDWDLDGRRDDPEENESAVLFTIGLEAGFWRIPPLWTRKSTREGESRREYPKESQED